MRRQETFIPYSMNVPRLFWFDSNYDNKISVEWQRLIDPSKFPHNSFAPVTISDLSSVAPTSDAVFRIDKSGTNRAPSVAVFKQFIIPIGGVPTALV
jgi:hypothetical protein